MAYHRKYFCSKCDHEFPRDELTVKKVQFQGIGTEGQFRKSRTEAWLCPECLKLDPIWNRVEYDAPGMQAAVREEVTNAHGTRASAPTG